MTWGKNEVYHKSMDSFYSVVQLVSKIINHLLQRTTRMNLHLENCRTCLLTKLRNE